MKNRMRQEILSEAFIFNEAKRVRAKAYYLNPEGEAMINDDQ